MRRNITRREIITKTASFGGAILTVGTVAGSEKDKTMLLSKGPSLRPEKKLSNEVPGYNIRKLPSGQYEIQYNEESLPDLSRMEKHSMEKNINKKGKVTEEIQKWLENT